MPKIIRVRKKYVEISSFLGGRPPLIFRLRGTRPPSLPPLSTPMTGVHVRVIAVKHDL